MDMLGENTIFFEIEVKFYITSHEAIVKQMNKLGANNVGKCFETNIRYENKELNLIKKKY